MQSVSADGLSPHDNDDLNFIFHIVKDLSGVCLPESDSNVLVLERLGPLLRENGFSTLSDLVSSLKAGRSGLRVLVVNALMNYETSFFRDKKPFDFFKTTLLSHGLEKNQQGQSARFWSAGCASGQEIYSLAMIVDQERKKDKTVNVDLVATDVSTPILDQAKRGIYSESDVRKGMTGELLRPYFRPHGDDWLIGSGIRRSVKFQHHNLLDEFGSLGSFDGIFCRNVVGAFDPKTRQKIIEKFVNALTPSGFLILGYGETLMGLSNRFHIIDGLRGGYRLAM